MQLLLWSVTGSVSGMNTYVFPGKVPRIAREYIRFLKNSAISRMRYSNPLEPFLFNVSQQVLQNLISPSEALISVNIYFHFLHPRTRPIWTLCVIGKPLSTEINH